MSATQTIIAPKFAAHLIEYFDEYGVLLTQVNEARWTMLCLGREYLEGAVAGLKGQAQTAMWAASLEKFLDRMGEIETTANSTWKVNRSRAVKLFTLYRKGDKSAVAFFKAPTALQKWYDRYNAAQKPKVEAPAPTEKGLLQLVKDVTGAAPAPAPVAQAASVQSAPNAAALQASALGIIAQLRALGGKDATAALAAIAAAAIDAK